MANLDGVKYERRKKERGKKRKGGEKGEKRRGEEQALASLTSYSGV